MMGQDDRFYEGLPHWNLWELELRWEVVNDEQWQLMWKLEVA